MRNSFKVLDQIERVSDELQTEVCNIVLEAVIMTILKGKKMQKGKMVFWRSLTKAEKRRDTESKGKNERYTHFKAELQSMGGWDKKAFLSDQDKEIEENNRMKNGRDLFQKIRNAKGIFQAKVIKIKKLNFMDLIEV